MVGRALGEGLEEPDGTTQLASATVSVVGCLRDRLPPGLPPPPQLALEVGAAPAKGAAPVAPAARFARTLPTPSRNSAKLAAERTPPSETVSKTAKAAKRPREESSPKAAPAKKAIPKNNVLTQSMAWRWFETQPRTDEEWALLEEAASSESAEESDGSTQPGEAVIDILALESE